MQDSNCNSNQGDTQDSSKSYESAVPVSLQSSSYESPYHKLKEEHDLIVFYDEFSLDHLCACAIIKQKYSKSEKQPLFIKYSEYMRSGDDISFIERMNANKLPIIFLQPLIQLTNILIISTGNDFQITWIDNRDDVVDSFKEYLIQAEKKISETDSFVNDIKLTDAVKDGNFKIISDSRCGISELLWVYFYGVDLTIPEAVIRIGDYYSFRKSDSEYKWIHETIPFYFGLRMLCKDIDTFPIQLLDTTRDSYDLVKTVISSGRVLRKFNDKQHDLWMKNAFDCLFFKGYHTLLINTPDFSPEWFLNYQHKDKYDLFITFVFNGDVWVFNIYNNIPNSLNLSELLKSSFPESQRVFPDHIELTLPSFDTFTFFVTGVTKGGLKF